METAHQTTKFDFDAIENDRIAADIERILGQHGAIATFQDPGDTGISGWSAFDGSVRILRADMPVCFAGDEEDSCTAEHRGSILSAIAEAYVAGRERVAIRERETGLGSPGYDYLSDFQKWREILETSCTVFQGEFLIEMDVALRDYVRIRDGRKEAAMLLAFAAQRLVNVYGENENLDVIRAMRRAVDGMAPPTAIEFGEEVG